MYKLIASILLLSALCSAEPLRRRSFLARQVEAPAEPPNPAPTGYPEAGITPEIPFDLPSSTVEPQPEINYLPPDNTYGPPASPDNVYGPPPSTNDSDDIPPTETDDEQPEQEDDIAKQQPVEEDVEEEKVLVEVAEDGTVIAVSTSLDQPKSGRLYQRFPQGNRRRQLPQLPVPQRLILRRNW